MPWVPLPAGSYKTENKFSVRKIEKPASFLYNSKLQTPNSLKLIDKVDKVKLQEKAYNFVSIDNDRLTLFFKAYNFELK